MPGPHVAIARGAGVEEAQIAALEQGEARRVCSMRPCAAFAFADEVLKNCPASDRTFTAVRDLFSPREIVELLMLIGYFQMISGVMTTLEVEVESPFGAEILASLN